VPDTVNVLILTSQANEAQDLITALRNGGLPAHGTHTQHPEQLVELAAAESCDLILCCVYDPQIDLQAALTHYQTLDRDIPLVLIADGQTPPETLTQAMRSGARDLTERDDPSRLPLVVTREFRDLQTRRTLAQVREQLERCEERARDLVEASDEASAFIQQGIHLSTNPAYRALFGFTQPEDLDGYPVLDLVAPEHQAGVKAFLRRHEAGDPEGPRSLDFIGLRTDGGRFDAEFSITATETDGEPCLRVAARVKPASHRAGETDAIDADTGLPGRAALMQELSKRLSASTGRPLALILLRLIGLERVAEGRGLSAAFNLAAQVAASLRGAVPEGGLLARVTDNVFALVVHPGTTARAHTLADDLRQRGCQALQLHQDEKAPASCVAGLALAGPNDRSGAVLLDQAFHDTEIQRVKDASPSGARRPKESSESATAPPDKPSATQPVAARQAAGTATRPRSPTPKPGEASAASPDPQVMAALVSEALSGTGKAALRLVYQPIVSLMGDSQEHYSVLVRLLDANQHLYEAKEFMGAAAAGGLMVKLDRWVIQRAIAELAGQRANDHRINFFVNIAEESLLDEELIIWICDLLREFDARGNWLTFQFPEEEARRNLAALTVLVEGLKKIKCRIALSRCSLLDGPQMLMQSLPVDFLLCAQDLARGLAEDKAKQQQLNAFANLAQEFNVKSIVTGVEDAPALTVLWTAKIDYVQGNFLQRPSPSLEING
jgi:multidomain signaling protein FimX